MLRFFLYSAASALLLATSLTRAEPIGPCFSDPGNPTVDQCDGATYTLSYIGEPLPDVNPQTETFRIFLDVDTTNYTGGGTFLDSVGIQVSTTTPVLIDATLTNAPGGIFNWTIVSLDIGVNDTGCSGPGGGFICVEGFEKGAALPGPFTFSFDVTVRNETPLFTDPLAAKVAARYVNASGARAGHLVEESITLQVIPEAETYAMLLLGLALLGAQMARRRS